MHETTLTYSFLYTANKWFVTSDVMTSVAAEQASPSDWNLT